MRLRFKRLRHVLASVLVLAGLGVAADPIPASQAAAHVGETATVCGTVAEVVTAWRSQGQTTFMDFDSAYPNADFVVVVWGADSVKVGYLTQFAHKQVCAAGLIQTYRGRPEIVVRDGAQIAFAAPEILSPTAPGASRATAICRDGTYSFSQHRRGTCSHYGGVGQWLGSAPEQTLLPHLPD